MSILNIFSALDLHGNFRGRAQMKNINPLSLKKEVSKKKSLHFFPQESGASCTTSAKTAKVKSNARARDVSSLRKIYFDPLCYEV